MQLNQLKIGPRLTLGFGVVVALMLALTGVAVVQLEQLEDDNARVDEMQRQAGVAAEWRSLAQLNASRAIAVAKAGSGSDAQRFFEPQIKTTSERITALQKELGTLATSSKSKGLVDTIATQRQGYLSASAEVLAHANAGKASATPEAVARLVSASEAYVAAIDMLSRYQNDYVKTTTEQAAAAVRSAEYLLVGLLGAALAAALGFGYAITRSVTRPLERTMAATERIAQGDLSEAIAAEGRDEMAALQRSLAHMQDALRALVTDVRSGSDAIGTASAQIASGNQDLSGRTEQTSSSLQQAASSLEQLTGTVGQTADSARTANQLAASATQAAERGGAVVSQVVSTMEEINTSSKKIADIIGTIDGIAFQTNILALNAAVEAARAGEQGRGFAVVASEVRSLAGRSADAAREIKALIGASVEKVESGSRLVQDAGSAMSDIVGGVRRVTDVIAEISAATSEQSSGLRQVNDAVAGLDRMTQQNAALVEESAAAAESMAGQAQRLSATVQRFRLAAGSAPAAAPAARAKPVAETPKAAAVKLLAKVKPAVAITTARAPAPANPAAKAAPAARPAPAAPPPAAKVADDGNWETF